MTLSLDQAVDLTRSGDIWLFRGRRAPYPRPANHAMLATQAPSANHQRPGVPWVPAIDPSRSTVSR